MKDYLHSYLKVGIVHFMAFPETMGGGGPVLETVSHIAKDDFFGAIEVTRVKDPETRAAVASMLDAYGLVLGYGAQPQLLAAKHDLNSLDDAKRRAAVQEVYRCVDEAVEMGAERVAVLSGADPGDARREAAMRALIVSLDEVCVYAQRTGGLGITLEVFDRAIDKKCLIGSTEEAVAIAKELRPRHPSFGLMIDLGHLPLQGETAEQSLTLARDYLVHVHIGNCMLDRSHPAYGDSHPRFGHPGGVNGVAELKEFLSTLLEIGYIAPGKQNVVAFEVKPLPGEAPDLVIANAKRTLREAWAILS